MLGIRFHLIVKLVLVQISKPLFLWCVLLIYGMMEYMVEIHMRPWTESGSDKVTDAARIDVLTLGGVTALQRASIYPKNGHVSCGGGTRAEGGT